MNASLESAFNYILKIPPVTTLGIEPQKTTIEDYNAENIYINRKEEIIFYTPIQSDKYRKLNPKFGKYTRNIATVGHNVTIIKLMNMDENNNENNFSLSIEDREVNDWADIEKSPYTLLTQAIGFNIENKNKHYFYVNPNHISTCMRYSHNELYVNWGTFEKKEFLHKSYDQCLQLLLKKTHLNMQRVKKLNIEKIATFRPTMLFPIMLLGKGASGCVLLVLKSVGNLITTTMPYALKMQKIPPVDNFSYYNIKYGTEKEVFFYSILEHPNILKMFNCYQFDSDWKLQLLEYVPYGTIGTFADETISYVDENGQERVFNFIEFTENLNPSKSFNKIEFIRYYSAQILIALEYLHVLGIRHFDLKPSNIGIGHRGYVKIFDFGLSCKFAEDYAYQNHTLDHKYIGCKEKRMSMCKPTVIGTATDIFAFGVTLVELFKGFHSKNYIDWTDYDLAREENVIEGNEMNEKNIPITRDIALNWFLKANAASTKVIRCFFVDNINFGLAEIIQTLKKVETKVQEEFKGSAYTTKIIEKLQNIFEMNEDIDAILENSFDFSNINNLLYEINEIFSKLGNNQSSNKTAVQEIKEHLNMIKYMKSLIEIFIGTYHFNDFKKRKTAQELLELDFYKDIINKEKLFKQEYDLEEICNFDLRDLFVFNYKTEYCKTMGYQCNIDDLGRIYHNPELWKKFLLYEF